MKALKPIKLRPRIAAAIAAIACACALAGCTSAYRARIFPGRILSDYRLTLYSGGVAVRTWETKGTVHSEDASDGYYFVDKSTGKIVEVSGQVVIEQLP